MARHFLKFPRPVRMSSVFFFAHGFRCRANQPMGWGSTTKYPTPVVGNMMGKSQPEAGNFSLNKRRNLTFVTVSVTTPLHRGAHSGCDPDVERGAAPARGLAIRSRAASGIIPSGTTVGAWGASTALGWEKAGNARRNHVPASNGLELSQRAKAPGESRKWSAGRRERADRGRAAVPRPHGPRQFAAFPWRLRSPRLTARMRTNNQTNLGRICAARRILLFLPRCAQGRPGNGRRKPREDGDVSCPSS